jgi:curved DNA-binding protein CbpA
MRRLKGILMKTQSKDYYAILGITPDATLADVKKAYRKLARKYHPDRNNSNPDSAARFRDITEAYDTLTDPSRRQAYDRTYRPAPGSKISTPVHDSYVISRLIGVLEDIWQAIRARHPEIPAVVIIVASGTEHKQARWGHHAPGRWVAPGNQARAEIMISGEGLRRDARSVLGTLLHEAAHALAATRGIKDTSRQGRYHNRHYKIHAEKLGLIVESDHRIGWAMTTVPGHTAAIYERQLQALHEAMTLWRLDETLAPTQQRSTNLIAAICPCARRIRVASSTLTEAPIVCLACGGKFQPADAA